MTSYRSCSKNYQAGKLPGDVLELGSWLGFGTAKLATLAGPSGKVVHTSDLFPVDFGSPTRSPYGTVRRYVNLYRGLTQRQVFDLNTAGHSNIEVHVGNVMDLTFPSEQRFVCSLIDSDHSYEAVCRCLELVWPHTTPGGLTFLSSYGNPDYPGVKKAADEFIAANSDDILSVRRKRQRRIIVVVKSPGGNSQDPDDRPGVGLSQANPRNEDHRNKDQK